MKKLLFPLLILCTTSSINCMDNSSKQRQPLTIELKQKDPSTEMYDFVLEKEILPKPIVRVIEKIEQWPDWAKQTTGVAACFGYLGYIALIGSYL